MSKKYYTFPTDTDKDNFVSKGKKRIQKGKIARRPNFPTELAGNVCQELAALIIICRSEVTVLNPGDLFGKVKTCFSQKRYGRVIE
jgi:hypothetical protein